MFELCFLEAVCARDLIFCQQFSASGYRVPLRFTPPLSVKFLPILLMLLPLLLEGLCGIEHVFWKESCAHIMNASFFPLGDDEVPFSLPNETALPIFSKLLTLLLEHLRDKEQQLRAPRGAPSPPEPADSKTPVRIALLLFRAVLP